MFFGTVEVDKALGTFLVHTVRVGGYVFKKGRVLSLDDITILKKYNITSLSVACLESEEVSEDQAADRIASAISDTNIRKSTPFTGRVNLFTAIKGIVTIDTRQVNHINHVDEAVTVATVDNWRVVEAGQILATIKIIPFAVAEKTVSKIESMKKKVIQVRPFSSYRVALIQTYRTDTKNSLLDKTTAVTRERLIRLGSSLVTEQRCLHVTESLKNLLQHLQKQRLDLLLIIGISAITDRRDVIPAALTQTNGTIDHFGMPVDPGNLLLLGRSDKGVPVIGLPGCARSLRLNGFDWILQRLLAGLPVTRDIIMDMGVGGLLSDTPTRPLSRTSSSETEARTQKAPRVGALLLAAGESRRMGEVNKLLLPIDGVPIIVRIFENIVGTSVESVVVVLGHNADEVRQVLDAPIKRVRAQGRKILVTVNKSFREGMGGSVSWGLRHISEEVEGVLVCLGDMPWVSSSVIQRLISSFNPLEGRVLCVPMVGTKRGNPVLWGEQFFTQLRCLRGDIGARTLLTQYSEDIVEVQTDPGVLMDIDSTEILCLLDRHTP